MPAKQLIFSEDYFSISCMQDVTILMFALFLLVKRFLKGFFERALTPLNPLTAGAAYIRVFILY